jgi:hypothetical protein
MEVETRCALRFFRMGYEYTDYAIIRIKEEFAPFRKAGEKRTQFCRKLLNSAEVLQPRGADIGKNANARLCNAAEIGDFTRMVTTQL